MSLRSCLALSLLLPVCASASQWDEIHAIYESVKNEHITHSAHATPENAAACIAAVKRVYSFRDPDSVRMEEGNGMMEPMVMVYESGAVMMYIYLNAKNAYGGYEGYHMFQCAQRPGGPMYAYTSEAH